MSADIKTASSPELLQEQLDLKNMQLRALFTVTQSINNNIKRDDLLKLYGDILRGVMGIEKMAIYTHFNDWNFSGGYNLEADYKAINMQKELAHFPYILPLAKTKHPFAKDFEYVIPTYHKDQPVAITLLGDSDELDEDTLEVSLTYIQTLTNLVAVAIENKKLAKRKVEDQRRVVELELAGKMQTYLLPDVLPNDERLQMSAVYLPYVDISGDYYDYMELNEDECMICIGDFSGHGVGAALLMSNLRASLRALMRRQESLKDFIVEFNSEVNQLTNGDQYMTLFIAKYNFGTRQLQYVNAGGIAPFVVSDGHVTTLQKGCTLMGVFNKLPKVEVGSLTLAKDAMLFCYTDGLVETNNEDDEPFGVPRLETFIDKEHALPVQAFNDKLLDYFIRFKGNRLFDDDVTLLTTRFF